MVCQQNFMTVSEMTRRKARRWQREYGNAYHEIYDRNEYAHDLTKDKLSGLITEVTGAEKDAQTTKKTVATISALKEFADFDVDGAPDEFVNDTEEFVPSDLPQKFEEFQDRPVAPSRDDDVQFAVSYTINLNLPRDDESRSSSMQFSKR